MNRTATLLAVLLAALAHPVPMHAQQPPAAPARGPAERHHYVMSARVRPLLLFWVSRDDVGDAVVARARDSRGAAYALLIGTDPERAPRRINRWGYIEEVIESGRARVRGLMTQSDEASVSEADANTRTPNAPRTFRVIRATVADGESRSVVTAVPTTEDYSFRHAAEIFELAGSGTSTAPRVLRIDGATRPGFLTALADVMHQQASAWRSSGQLPHTEAVRYVYHGKQYRLSVTGARAQSSMRIGALSYDHVITSQYRVDNLQDGAVSEFSMSYAADGALAELPLAVTYRPRWWLEVHLTLDDRTSGPRLATGFER